MKNRDRSIVRLIDRICLELHIEIRKHSHEWILALRHNGRTQHIFGYDFPLNHSVAQLLAKDKAACSEILSSAGLLHIQHLLVLHPQIASYVGSGGVWAEIQAFAARFNYDVVCKPNTGTGGVDVEHTRSAQALESHVQHLFCRHRAICISPYVDVANEYRVVLLAGMAQLIYSKRQSMLIGDGIRSVGDLFIGFVREQTQRKNNPTLGSHLVELGDLSRVPLLGEKLRLNWRHNLGQGAEPTIVKPGSPPHDRLASLAKQAAAALGLTFCSVDLVEFDAQLSVLEINAGVMLESFTNLLGSQGDEIAYHVYRKALCRMFDL